MRISLYKLLCLNGHILIKLPKTILLIKMDLDCYDNNNESSCEDIKDIINFKSVLNISDNIVISLTFSDGKMCKSIFDYLDRYPDFIMKFFPEGIEIEGVSYYNSGDTLDSITYFIIKENKLLEYNYNKKFIRTDEGFCIKVPSGNFSKFLKKISVSNTVQIQIDKKSENMLINLVESSVVKNFFIKYSISNQNTCHINKEMMKLNNLNFRIGIETFCKEMASKGEKYADTNYDYMIKVYKEGISIISSAPGISSVNFGNTNSQALEFTFDYSSAKSWVKAGKISPRTIIGVSAINDSFIKFSLSTGSIGEFFIFQFPKDNKLQLMNNYQGIKNIKSVDDLSKKSQNSDKKSEKVKPLKATENFQFNPIPLQNFQFNPTALQNFQLNPISMMENKQSIQCVQGVQQLHFNQKISQSDKKF